MARVKPPQDLVQQIQALVDAHGLPSVSKAAGVERSTTARVMAGSMINSRTVARMRSAVEAIVAGEVAPDPKRRGLSKRRGAAKEARPVEPEPTTGTAPSDISAWVTAQIDARGICDVAHELDMTDIAISRAAQGLSIDPDDMTKLKGAMQQ